MRRRFLVPSLVLITGCAFTLTSCAGADQEGSAAHRMSVWTSGTTLGEDIGTLIADNARVAKDVPNGTGAVHAACATTLNDAEMANTNLPSPDPDVTALLTKAYGLEGTSANQCFSGRRDQQDAPGRVRPQRHQGGGALPAGPPAHPPDRRAHGLDDDHHRQLVREHLRVSADSDRQPDTDNPGATTSSTAIVAASCGPSPPGSTSSGVVTETRSTS